MIQLSEDYRITFELKGNVTLEKKHIVEKSPLKKSKREGEVEWRELGYFTTVGSAVKFYINENLKDSSSLNDLMIRLSKLEKQVEDLFRIRFSQFYQF